MEDLVGKTVDRYKIIGEIGRGGMAIVYRAIDSMLDRNVAIKIIMPEYADKEKLLKRFSREAKSLAKLSHSNIVKVLDYGEYEGSPYLVMEYIPGGTLSSMLGKPMNYAEAAALLAPVARALNYAHQQKVVHRDIKPGNILINESGQALLSDFGILKLLDAEETQGLTGTGKIVGTPSYMSPEQIRGLQIDGRADIYSLGIVFFEMITGRKPYIANTPIELSLKHLNESIPRARQFVRDLPTGAEQVFLKAMAKKPEERYQSMAAFADDLEKLGGKLSVATNKQPVVSVTGEKKGSDENKPKVLKQPLVILVSMLAIIGFGGFFIFRPENGTNLAPAIAASPTMEILPTETLIEPSPMVTFTPEVVSTITPAPTKIEQPVDPTATSTQLMLENAISADNVSRLMEVNKVEKISVINLGWTPDGKWIVDAGSGAISFINPQKMPAVDHKIAISGEIPTAIAISSLNDNLYVLIKAKINVYSILTQKLVTSYPISGGVHSIAISPDGKYLALGILDNKVQLIDPENGSVLRNLRSSYGGWSVLFSPDSQIVVGGNTQGALMWEADTGTWLNLNGGQDSLIKSLAFSKDGKILAGGSKGIIFLWDVATGDSLNQLTGQFTNVNSVDFSPDNSILAAATDDGTILLWDVEQGSLLKTLTGHTSPVFGAYFAPDGVHIVSGANEGVIRLWGIP
jgi:tRNA A-37 threonylcarbamoyl transferase component Bud32